LDSSFILQVRAFPLELYTQKNILSTACRFVVVKECDRRKVTASITDVSSCKCMSLIMYMSCHSSYVTLQWTLPTCRRYLQCSILARPTAGLFISLLVHVETLLAVLAFPAATVVFSLLHSFVCTFFLLENYNYCSHIVIISCTFLPKHK